MNKYINAHENMSRCISETCASNGGNSVHYRRNNSSRTKSHYNIKI